MRGKEWALLVPRHRQMPSLRLSSKSNGSRSIVLYSVTTVSDLLATNVVCSEIVVEAPRLPVLTGAQNVP